MSVVAHSMLMLKETKEQATVMVLLAAIFKKELMSKKIPVITDKCTAQCTQILQKLLRSANVTFFRWLRL